MQHFMIMQTRSGVVIAKTSLLSVNMHLLKKKQVSQMCSSFSGGAVSGALLLPAQHRLASAPASSRMNKLEHCKLFHQDEKPSYLVKNHYCRAVPYNCFSFSLLPRGEQRLRAALITHLPPVRGEHPRREVI